MSFVKEGRIDRAKKQSEVTVNQTYFTVIRGRKKASISGVSFSSGRKSKIIIPIFIIIQTACRLQNKRKGHTLCICALPVRDRGVSISFPFHPDSSAFYYRGTGAFPEVKRSAHSQDKVGGLQLFPAVMYYSVKAMIR